MLEWETVEDGRVRALSLQNGTAAWVRVGEEGTVHFFTGIGSMDELSEATPMGGLDDFINRLRAIDAIDIVCRALGGEDPGPMTDG